MSIVATTSFFGFLILFLSNATVNASSIYLFCPYPSNEFCKVQHRANNVNRYRSVHDLGPIYATVDEESLYVNLLGEDTQKLRNQIEAFRNTPPSYEDLVRCINLGDDSCNNGSLPGSGKDDDFLNGSGNPGKRSESRGMNNKYEPFRNRVAPLSKVINL